MKQNTFIFIIILLLMTNIKETEIFDKMEFINRRIYAFNRGIDYILTDPATKIYVNIVPKFITNRIDDFFKNSEEIQNLIVYYKILNKEDFYYHVSRIMINSTFGLLGLFDIAKKIKKPYKEYNLNNIFLFHKSSYIMIPVIGPGTLKNTIFLLTTQIFNPYIYIFKDLIIFYFLEIINKKSQIMFDNMFFHKNFIDSYSFLKDIYMQNIMKEDEDKDYLLEPPE